MAYVMLNNMMLQTVGENLRAYILAMARQGLFFIPAILILPRLFDFTGVMITQPISDLCSFLLAVPLSTSFLRKMRRMEEEENRLKTPK
jgi:Na+-driven multidrug efflux pump